MNLEHTTLQPSREGKPSQRASGLGEPGSIHFAMRSVDVMASMRLVLKFNEWNPDTFFSL